MINCVEFFIQQGAATAHVWRLPTANNSVCCFSRTHFREVSELFSKNFPTGHRVSPLVCIIRWGRSLEVPPSSAAARQLQENNGPPWPLAIAAPKTRRRPRPHAKSSAFHNVKVPKSETRPLKAPPACHLMWLETLTKRWSTQPAPWPARKRRTRPMMEAGYSSFWVLFFAIYHSSGYHRH